MPSLFGRSRRLDLLALSCMRTLGGQHGFLCFSRRAAGILRFFVSRKPPTPADLANCIPYGTRGRPRRCKLAAARSRRACSSLDAAAAPRLCARASQSPESADASERGGNRLDNCTAIPAPAPGVVAGWSVTRALFPYIPLGKGSRKLWCRRYEGIYARVLQNRAASRVSIGVAVRRLQKGAHQRPLGRHW